MGAPRIEVEVVYDAVRILINGVLHLNLTRSKLIGVQAWAFEKRGMWQIEYTMEGGAIQSDYDDRKKWLAVLDGLKRVL